MSRLTSKRIMRATYFPKVEGIIHIHIYTTADSSRKLRQRSQRAGLGSTWFCVGRVWVGIEGQVLQLFSVVEYGWMLPADGPAPRLSDCWLASFVEERQQPNSGRPQ